MSRFIDEPRGAKEINLFELYKVIKKRFWVILIFIILAGTAAFFYSTYNKTTLLYQSSTNIIIGAEAGYRNTLQVIIKDTIVLEKVIGKLGLSTTSDQLANRINVESIDDTQVVKISVTDTNSKNAADIANTTAKVFIEEIPKIMDFEEVSVLSEAKMNPRPINESSQIPIIIIAIVFGVIAGVGFIFLLDSLDDSIKTEREIERLLDVQVIGSVSKMDKKNVRQMKIRQSTEEMRGKTIESK
ncbi:YveK family protein [Cytobacillus purgationiresistens]|uniref:Capsular polysaccharide biosynthesis protein n=1 Tax=Cytobacillus purgationiresistens TaxID=863449 RepID=A0ABU0ALL9_9BACI|nr:Wzz/FepE/Etk N-terminal domain-containing protein [Cytobacillus purgationiresistens]MDQ0270920.1 capsular polysaccharide biosynthesis protein [Cytobacillus purgationiresistens]